VADYANHKAASPSCRAPRASRVRAWRHGIYLRTCAMFRTDRGTRMASDASCWRRCSASGFGGRVRDAFLCLPWMICNVTREWRRPAACAKPRTPRRCSQDVKL
jgi:hypothetical protein